MSRPVSRGSTAALFAGALALLLAGSASAERGISSGAFRDRDGTVHRWSIQSSHLLEWDGKPYVPIGVVFHSQHLKAPSDSSLSTDERTLDGLKSAGITDVWIEPGRGLLDCRTAEIQAVIDALEVRGFKYGLRVRDRYRAPLIGFAPGAVPLPIKLTELQPGAVIRRRIQAPGARRVVYNLTDIGANEQVQNFAVATGQAIVEGDGADIQIEVPRTRLIGKSRGLIHTMPEVQVEPEELGSFGNLWHGMEEYTERLAAQINALRFGPGVRFILDPFQAGDGTTGQEESIFPSTPDFQTAFTEWLSRRYGVQTLNSRWRLNDRRLLDMEEAGRLVPTWSRNDPPDGDGWLIDHRQSKAYRCRPRECRIWDDLDTFRAETLRKLMNQVALQIDKTGLDVPVIFTWAAYHPVFTNFPSPAGYEGLAAEVPIEANEDAQQRAAYALAQVEEGARTGWLIASRFRPEEKGASPSPGDIAGGWTRLRSAGYRGGYFDPLLTPGAEGAALALCRIVDAGAEGLTSPASSLFFPIALATSDRVTQLSTGVWWLPSVRDARLMRYGQTLMGYDMPEPFGPEHAVQKATVLWSTTGPQELTFFLDRGAEVQFMDSAGQPIKVDVRSKDRRATISVGPEPILATGLDTLSFFPMELTTGLLEELVGLVEQARRKGIKVESYDLLLKEARGALNPASAATLYNTLYGHVQTLRESLLPYVWIEGERAISHSFSGVVFHIGAAGGTMLSLERDRPPRSGVYKARYQVDVTEDGGYEIWVAGLIPGAPGVSPLVWQLNDEDPVELKSAEAASLYGKELGWYRLGNMALPKGRHFVTLIASAPAVGGEDDGRYRAAIDAVVFSRRPFTPQGSERPTLAQLENPAGPAAPAQDPPKKK